MSSQSTAITVATVMAATSVLGEVDLRALPRIPWVAMVTGADDLVAWSNEWRTR